MMMEKAAKGANRQMTERRNAEVERRLAERLRSGGGRMTFAAFMQLCLYEPGVGYYQREETKLGKEGDFYTSAHVGGVMGACIASRLAVEAERTAERGERIAILEWGGGDGRLAASVLDELRHAHPELYERISFFGAEGSAYHRRLQQERLAEHMERVEGIVPPDDERIVRALEERPVLLFANELLDAFPVHVFERRDGDWREVYVELDETAPDFAVRETLGNAADEAAHAWIRNHPLEAAAEGQRIEIGMAGLRWLAWLGSRMRRGFALFSDYGDRSAELYGPHRLRGTLLAYRRHTASSDVLHAPGTQDLTAHVNFEWCAEQAAMSGFEDIRVAAQKQFLIEQGVLQRLQNHAGLDPFSPEARSNRAIRQLLLSDGMSELFKVMTMAKR